MYGIESPPQKNMEKLDQRQASAAEFRRSMSEGLLKRAGQQATEACWVDFSVNPGENHWEQRGLHEACGGFHKWRYPKIDGLEWKIPSRNGWLGGAPILGNLHVITRNEVAKQVKICKDPRTG